LGSCGAAASTETTILFYTHGGADTSIAVPISLAPGTSAATGDAVQRLKYSIEIV
jgi:hypothetical protein